MIDIAERARRYVAKMPPAISGQGGHNATFAVAMVLIKGFDLSISEARPILAEFNARCDPEWTAHELEHKLTSADGTADDKARGWLIGQEDPERRQPAPDVPPPARAKFESSQLKQFAARWRDVVTTAWLADRSALDPLGLTAEQFLRAIYSPAESILIFTNNQSQGQALWPNDEIPTSGPEGVWFLAQPVDGEIYPNPRSLDETGKPKPSRRSEESVTSWRFLVLESDTADVRDWIAALVQLPLAIAAIYTSGKRSIHALIRVDAASITDWRNFSSAIRAVLVTLGADQQVVSSAVRLTRLPGCFRSGRLQKLLYLNPHAGAKAICTLPRLRDVVAHWTSAALKLLPYHAGEILDRAKVKTLDDCIAALEQFSTPDISAASIKECIFALEWFSTSPAALETLGKIKSRFDA